MAQQKRQSNLYNAEDWTMVYEAFAKINLTAYDYDSIRQSMIDFLRVNYADSFNDWSENTEFLFILDTISFLGQNLAFRMDMNTRENFLDTAQRRSSVLKLAKMISYAPKRSYPGRALAKVTEIKTNQDVRNSFGISLKNQPIRWNDPADPNWYENFILVMNSVLISSNQFGDPIKKITANSISNQIYRMNTIPMSAPNIPFNAVINGETMNFEVVNPDLTSNGVVEERHPEPQAQKNIIYKNDGNGFESPNTGFFVYFKQGNLTFSDFQYNDKIENRVQQIDANNINELDVWVQETTADGLVREKWTKVPAIESISYNSVNRNIKRIYSVTTRDNDQITLKFPDNRSGVVPKGSFRVWYRVSNGKSYTLKTSDIQSKSIKYSYRTSSQSNYETSTLDIKFTMQFQSASAQSKETIEQIKERAPQMYYTQNRFVNGEDYNIAPLSLGNTVLKAKAINRIYSGQSRFIDINDPTGKYQNTDIFSDDGSIYRERANSVDTVPLPTAKSSTSIVVDSIQPLISDNSVIQFFQEYPDNNIVLVSNDVWVPEYNSRYQTNTFGKIVRSGSTIPYQVGSILNFVNNSGVEMWSSVVELNDDGSIVLSKAVPAGQRISSYIKAYRVKFTNSEVQSIANVLETKTDFVLIFNPDKNSWIPIKTTTMGDTIEFEGSTYPVLVQIQYTPEYWVFNSNGVDYIFVGGDKVKFYFVSTKDVSDISNGSVKSDKIEILSYNSNYENNNGYSSNIDLQILDSLKQENGYLDGSRVIVTSANRDSNGIPLSPNQFRELVPAWTGEDKVKFEQWIFFKQYSDFTVDVVNSDFTFLDTAWTYTENDVAAEANAYKRNALQHNIDIRSTSINDLYNHGSGFVICFTYDGKQYFVEQTVGNNNGRLNQLIANMTLPTDTSAISAETALYRAMVNQGSTDVDENKQLSYYGYVDVSNQFFIKKDARLDINFHWKHYAPDDNRIDPSKTNIMDMFVLTSAYKSDVEIWLKNGAKNDFPRPPTSTELKDMFASVENRIVQSDTCIWHSAKYLPLFGAQAQPDYRATFKVVKLQNSKLSDDEIRQKVIELVNSFFDVANWDFGESFFFTELSTFIHLNLSTEIASVVIVPENINSKFGELFEIPCQSDELFVNTAGVDNVIIVNSLAKSNINIGS